MQPMFLTWNVMGMMNNCLFRVKVHELEDGTGFWFEHPTQPGNEPGGWMTEEAGKFEAATATECAPGRTGVPPNRPTAAVWDAGAAVGGAGSATTGVANAKRDLPTTAGKLVTSTEEWVKNGITMEEVEKHNHEGSVWIAVKDRVYDCTPYLKDHPGGAASIMIAAGQEATDDFEAVHSKKAWDMLEDHYMGPLVQYSSTPKPGKSLASLDDAGDTFLRPREFQKMPLVEKIIVNHDTRIFRFALPRPDMKLGLPTGQHIFLKAKYEGKVVMRPYSPMTDDNTLGHVDFIIKVYFKNVHPRFPEGGKMSQHLDSMKIGDTIEAKGPLGEFVYEGNGNFSWMHKPGHCKQLSLIAGGTGISLPYQVASKVLSDPNDPTKIKLLFANQTPDDILAKDYIDELVKKHSDRFEVWYTVDRVPETYAGEWKYDVGFINDAMISRSLFPASEDTVCLMCGPPIMYEKACIPNLLKVGYSRDNIFEG